MKARIGLLLLLGIGLAGCGGGGGGGVPSPSPSPPPPGGQQPPPPQQPAPPEQPPPSSTAPSSANILFPWHGSAALASTVTVSGTASDPDGVAVVRVNGVAATIVSSASGAVGSGTHPSAVRARAPLTELRTDHEEAPTEVEWVVEVTLEDGENELAVVVEDDTGDVTEETDAVAVRYFLVPIPFRLDEHSPRVVGRTSTLAQFGSLDLLVQHNYATQEQFTYPELFGNPVEGCLRGLSDQWLYLMMASDDWHLRRFDFNLRESQLIAPIPPAQLDPGEGFDKAPLSLRLVCSDAHTSSYVLANYSADGSLSKSRILEIDGAGQVSLLTQTDPEASPPWLAEEIALTSDAILSIRGLGWDAPLTRIDLVSGEHSSLAPSVVDGLALAPALESQRVYVATFAGIDEINLSVEPPTRHNISAVSSTDPFVFTQVRSLALDLVNNRLIVGDSGLDMLIAVDLATGERSRFLSRSVGTGPPLIAPRRMALTADGALAYVADDGGNAPERLFEIELASGDRRLVGDINLPFNAPLSGIALDEDAGYVYVSRYDHILRVNIETGGVAVIADIHDPASPLGYIADIALDAANHRLLVGDSAGDAIYELNLNNNQLNVVSRAGTHGEGDPFVTIASMTMDEDGSTLYVADQGTDRIVRVDLESGDRDPLVTACPLGVEPETLGQVLYDADRNQLLIRADGVFAHDLETSACVPVPSRLYPLDVRLTPSGRILATAFNAVVQIDRHTGDMVIVSK